MATKTWIGAAPVVAQVSTGAVLTYDAASTYTVTIGDVEVSQVGDTDVATTAAALQVKLAASTHPYFAAVTWTNPSGGTITGTSAVAGVPFVAAITVSGGTGTVTAFSTTTAASSPHHVNLAANWSGAALPGAADDVVVAGGASLLYGLDGMSAALDSFTQRQSFTGLIGLEPQAFATSLDGATLSETVPEYRDYMLEVNAPAVDLGQDQGPGSPAGSQRVNIDQQIATAAKIIVSNTSSSTLAGRPAVRISASDADVDLEVRSAPGGVGVAIEAGEVATLGDVLISDTTGVSGVYLGSGCTWANYEQYGGSNVIRAAANVSEVKCRGGELDIEGEDYSIATLRAEGGSCTDRHRAASGNDWTTVYVDGGTWTVPAVQEAARNAGTINFRRGVIDGDMSRLTATAWSLTPATGQRALMRFSAQDQ